MSRRAEIATRAALIGMGLFTAVPVIAVVQPGQLESSYGVTDPAPMVLTLLQHRGVFQLLAGLALIWAAFRPAVRVPVAIGVIVAKSSALLLTVTRPEAQALVSTPIQVFDVACIALLALIAGAALIPVRRPAPNPAAP
ncbi:hypothetical protein KOI35_09530 [Actinoplanes bogorensis]|uniref:Phosphopantetheine adenylyltransferase n=1 Tax=Paractinoplanes bogorensis TaxID=1610840 RepID=A0ABS5YJU7_9ACTN|nr:hypothetical protein [Actinoplanes bogorensis]MBU2663748.1 hypothetical protein [Actinoplanes bogorensis]